MLENAIKLSKSRLENHKDYFFMNVIIRTIYGFTTQFFQNSNKNHFRTGKCGCFLCECKFISMLLLFIFLSVTNK